MAVALVVVCSGDGGGGGGGSGGGSRCGGGSEKRWKRWDGFRRLLDKASNLRIINCCRFPIVLLLIILLLLVGQITKLGIHSIVHVLDIIIGIGAHHDRISLLHDLTLNTNAMEDAISDPTRAARGFVTLVAEYVVPVLFDIVRVAHQRFSRPFVVFLCDILPLQCTIGLFSLTMEMRRPFL